MTGLPSWINASLQQRLENVSRADLRARAQAMSEAYRAGGTSDVIRSDADALAYAVVRMPATYAAVEAALTQALPLLPDFAPRSMLDVGAGPGTASWAALDAWPSLQTVAAIDANPHLLALAQGLHGASALPTAFAAERGNFTTMLGKAETADVVMASYALTEVPSASIRATLEQLWRLANSLLVIVEPGTVAGFKRILAYRQALLGLGAEIVAPCSHDSACPLEGAERWCHFSVRLPRSRDHLITKSASVPYEDEKFSYLVAGKGLGAIKRGRRILATPVVTKAHVALTLCAPDKPGSLNVARTDKDAYRAAKRGDWGDAIDT